MLQTDFIYEILGPYKVSYEDCVTQDELKSIMRHIDTYHSYACGVRIQLAYHDDDYYEVELFNNVDMLIEVFQYHF